jgi:thiol-disulfide isomerase/thioredoxin
MKKLYYIIITVIALQFFYSCDKIEPTNGSHYYIADTISSTGETTGDSVIKKVVIVDFTGIRCVNCPNAHETIHQLQSVYPGKIIAIAIHGTGLAYPISPFVTDLRTQDGNEIISTFGINAIPVGLIDHFDKEHLTQLTGWADEVDAVINETPQVGIKIDNTFNTGDSTTNIDIEITALQKFTESAKLFVFVLEDSIITRQASEEGDIENYVQLNVFRDALSDVWGDNIFANGADEDFVETKNFSVKISANWDVNNCKIVTFVADNSNKILNAQSQKIK